MIIHNPRNGFITKSCLFLIVNLTRNANTSKFIYGSGLIFNGAGSKIFV